MRRRFYYAIGDISYGICFVFRYYVYAQMFLVFFRLTSVGYLDLGNVYVIYNAVTNRNGKNSIIVRVFY